MKRPLAVSLLMIAGCAVAGLTSIPNERNYLGNGESKELANRIRAGFVALKANDFSLASSHFEQAVSMPKDELPNYEPYIPLAFAECLAGRMEHGRKILTDAKCMLDVDAGEVMCPDGNQITSDFLRMGGTEQCYATMCGELYLASYGAHTEQQATHFANLRSDIDIASINCEK